MKFKSFEITALAAKTNLKLIVRVRKSDTKYTIENKSIFRFSKIVKDKLKPKKCSFKNIFSLFLFLPFN